MAGLVAVVSGAVAKLSQPTEEAAPPQQPAVNPKKSVYPDYIISLEDGSQYKSLKRHLSSKYGMTPDEYRAKWGLPRDYPMVAPNYAAARSALAKKLGLGRKPKPAPVKSAGRRKATLTANAARANSSKPKTNTKKI
jgi:predicted transcriptional regulator